MDNAKMHRTGRIWTIIVLSIICAVPFLMMAIFKEAPNWGAFFSVFFMMCLYYIPVGVGEVFTYSYLLGTNGTYLAFVTGNLSNLKIPCVINAVNLAGTEVGTEETELVSTISIATSALTTITIIAIGVLLFAPFSSVLSNPALEPGFQQVVFALFGALGGQYVFKYPKIAVGPILGITALCILLILIPATSSLVVASYVLFVGVIVCFLVARKLYGPKKTGAAATAATADTTAVSDTTPLEDAATTTEPDEAIADADTTDTTAE